MGKKKQKKQSPKKVEKKQAGKKSAVKVKGKKIIDALEEERRLLQDQVAALQRQLEQASQSRPYSEPSDEPPKIDEAFKREATSQHKIDWERYSFLHDRYEVYIEEGVDKVRAGKLANEDLMAKFGKKAGYTDEQLECIFV